MEIPAQKLEQNLAQLSGQIDSRENEPLIKAISKEFSIKNFSSAHKASNDESYEVSKERSSGKNTFIKLGEFIGDRLLGFSTGISASLNVVSAIFRLTEDSNPIKKIVNFVSMLFTKAHQILYSLNGLSSGLKQKNPILSFSFSLEGLASLFDLRKMYLFRGIATALDAIPAALENKTKQRFYGSYSEAWSKLWSAFKETLRETKNNPGDLIKEFKQIGASKNDSGEKTLVTSSLATILGSLWGLFINEAVGGSGRDFTGAFGDIGLFMKDDKLAKLSGFFYALGSGKDFIARIFNKKIANWLGIAEIDKFTRFRDFFHELSIASDKFGQLFFAKYNAQGEKTYS
jgi:hypothetical protein